MSHQMARSKMLCPIFRGLLAASCCTWSLLAQNPATLRARVVLGLEGVANDSVGELAIRDNAIVFSRREGASVQIPLSAIQGAFLSEEDKQVGGTPMALGRAATPFGGGRVIGLFSHKKYDFLTLESFDSNGGFHGTIYQLNRGEGQALAKELVAKGLNVSGLKVGIASREAGADNAK